MWQISSEPGVAKVFFGRFAYLARVIRLTFHQILPPKEI